MRVAYISDSATFSKAFADARLAGADEFNWRGGRYSTKLADNEKTKHRTSVYCVRNEPRKKNTMIKELKDASDFADSDYVDWSDGADILRKAKSLIEELEAQLEKVTAEREHAWSMVAKCDGDVVRQSANLIKATAAIPRAYRMGLEDAADPEFIAGVLRKVHPHNSASSNLMLAHEIANEIRAIPTPTDLVERVMKETNND